MSDIQSLLEVTEENMMDAIAAMQRDFESYRTGKASSSLVEGIMVEHYGTSMRLRDIAGITTPEPRLIVIQPWDKSAVASIEKALQSSNIGIMPLNDGKVIRLPIPDLSEERRKDLSKQTAKRAEEAKIHLRNHRKDANDVAKKAAKAAEINEDEERSILEDIQKLTNDYTKQVDDLAASKIEEIMKV